MTNASEFDYRIVKDGRILISWRGKQVVTLAGKKADKFRNQIDGLDDNGAQLLMARMTGNFKRGNERPR
ncbi:MAG: hypothetical protein HOC74_15285 [Gemmatimonadetes bacterium]|jgi:hypothetical protein|nr:hypothetical protein [Gemmatimonadota bacterium]